MGKFNLLYREKLLSDISSELRKVRPNIQIGVIHVIFKIPEQNDLEIDLRTALDIISNDLYWNENQNFSLAYSAQIRII